MTSQRTRRQAPLGPADVYLVAHHGNAFSGVPAVAAAVRPRVAIVHNGEIEGGEAKTFTVRRATPGLEDLWQLHRTAHEGARPAEEGLIANRDLHTSYRVKRSASEDGISR